MMNKKSFCKLVALAAFGCLSTEAESAAENPNVKFGVLSDLHVTTWESAETFRSALRFYRDESVDAVMICGDLTDMGVLCNLENVARSWYEVFPDNKGADGKRVEKLFIYGNHDVEPVEYGVGHVKLARSILECPGLRAEEVRKQRLDIVGLGQAWEQCFHEPFAPIYRKTVKGYDFIGAHWDTQARVRGLDDWFGENGRNIDRARPFFFFQHPHPKGTVNTDGPFTHDDGSSTRILSEYPNAVAFSGHSHTTLTDDRTIWQGAFTSIGASTLNYRGAEPGLLIENTFSTRDPVMPAQQGMLVSVFDDRITVVRRDFHFNEVIDKPWCIQLPIASKDRTVRMNESVEPQFAADAVVNLVFPKSQGGEGQVRFAPAVAETGARPYEYEIHLEYRHGDDVTAGHMFRVFGPTSLLPKAHDADVKRVSFTVPSAYMPKYDLGEARLTVVPRNSLGKAGKGLSTGWIAIPKM